MSECRQFRATGKGYEILERHTPPGIAWLAWRIPDKKAYQLWGAFSTLLNDAWSWFCGAIAEASPYTTTNLIGEWEAAVSLPDPCLPATETLAQRRAQVQFRLTKRRWTTEQDWKDLAALFGLTITVTPGWLVQKPALFPSCFPVHFFAFEKLGRFRVYVDIDDCGDGSGFAYDFGYDFSGNTEACEQFKCIIERVKPANVVVIWNQDPVGQGWLTCG